MTGLPQSRVANSRLRLLIVSILMSSSGYCSAQHSYRTWHDLQQLQPGTQLVVVTAHHLSCTLVEVTDDEIVCQQSYRGLGRNRVQEVRLGAGKKGAVVGAVIGGGVGGALASTSSGGNQGVKIAAGAGLGAAVGGVIGLITGNAHGKVIYRR
jgi:hypothetical protein